MILNQNRRSFLALAAGSLAGRAFGQLPLFDPGSIRKGTGVVTDNLIWYKPEALTGYSDNDPLTGWPDSSGRGNNGTVGSVIAVPKYRTNQINGIAAVEFTAADRGWVQMPSCFSGSETGAEVFIVVKTKNDPAASLASSGCWTFANLADNYHFPFTDGAIYEGFCASSRHSVGNPTPALTDWNLINISSQSGASGWIYRINGTGIYTGTSTFVTSSSDGTYARRLGQAALGGGNIHLDGYIAEVKLYGSVLSSGARSAENSYFASKYNLTIA